MQQCAILMLVLMTCTCGIQERTTHHAPTVPLEPSVERVLPVALAARPANTLQLLPPFVSLAQPDNLFPALVARVQRAELCVHLASTLLGAVAVLVIG